MTERAIATLAGGGSTGSPRTRRPCHGQRRATVGLSVAIVLASVTRSGRCGATGRAAALADVSLKRWDMLVKTAR